MSGGSLNYAFIHVEELASNIKELAQNDLEKLFADHLKKCAVASKKLEWAYSSDISIEEAHNAIIEVLNIGSIK